MDPNTFAWEETIMARWTTAVIATAGLGLLASGATAQMERELTPGGPMGAPPAMEQPAPDELVPGRSERAGAATEYVVKEGDTLSAIAERALGTRDEWRRIAQANGIDDPTHLKVGQRLEIPARSGG